MTEAEGPAGVERFRAHLEACNLPVTRQRLRIARILFGTHRHISAEEILALLEADGRPVGKATVYRTLSLMAEAGFVREHDFGDGVRRYEPVPDRPHHEHLVCTRCGKVIEFEAREIARVQSEIAELHRFRPTYHRMEIYGLCEECQE